MKTKSFKSDIVELFRELNSFSDFLKKTAEDIHKDDRLASIIVFAGLELVVDFLVEKLCKRSSEIKKSRVPFMGKVILLNEIGVVDDKLFKNLKAISKIRGAAAHPLKRFEWEDKFAFDKSSDVYKQTVEVFGEPKDLVGYLHCVWHTLFLTGEAVCASRHLGKMIVAHKKFEQKR